MKKPLKRAERSQAREPIPLPQYLRLLCAAIRTLEEVGRLTYSCDAVHDRAGKSRQ